MARILIVEDESNLAQGLLFNLKAEGHEVRVEAKGESALETLRREPFDAVVLDVMLPGKDGLKSPRLSALTATSFPCSCSPRVHALKTSSKASPPAPTIIFQTLRTFCPVGPSECAPAPYAMAARR